MLNKLYEQLGYSSVAVIIISVSLILFLGFFATRITKLLKLPNVTAYVATGVIIGPYCFNLVPQAVISGMGFISDIALAFISFGIGEFFKFSILKKNMKSVTVITLMGIAVTSLLIFFFRIENLKNSPIPNDIKARAISEINPIPPITVCGTK